MCLGVPDEARTRPAVLILTGVGLTAAVARRPIAELQKRFLVLGPAGGGQAEAGNIGVPTAEDALALLEAAGAEEAHVVGLSFGATVAQEIAIRYPNRVSSLILGSSTAGGELYAPPERAVRDFVRRLGELPAEEGLWASVPYLYAAATWRRHAPLVGEDIARRMTGPLDPRAYSRQRAIARAHDAAVRLREITVPTLVLHGEQDRILPLDNGRRLAAAIHGAQFMSLPGGGHAFPTDVSEANQTLVSFLLAHPRRRQDSAPRRTRRATRA